MCGFECTDIVTCAGLHGVHRTCTEMAAVSRGTSHVTTKQRCLCTIRWILKILGSNVRLIDDGPLSSFQGRSSSASSFHASLLQAIDGMMSLALCPQVVSQASQHFRSSEKQATCEGCFARQSTCSVVSLHPGMSRVSHPQEF